MKKSVSILLIIMLFCSLFGCSEKQARTATFFAMDTFITLSAYDSSDETFQKVTSLINELDRKLSRTKEDSDISRLNSAGTSPVSLSDEAAELLALALGYCEESSGIFDITVAPLTDLWDIKSETPRIPENTQIASALQLVNYKYLTLNGNEASFLSEGMSCDLGGIAKGFAADKAVELLRADGITSALLQVSSSVYVLGEKPDGSSYTVGIRDPEGSANEYLGKLSLKDKYITSSGDYERYFEVGGKRYCHIFDTKTGHPTDNDLRSVTVITDNGTEGDFLSTLLFCLGLENGLRKCRQEGISAVFITKDKRIFTCGSETASFELTNGEYVHEK